MIVLWLPFITKGSHIFKPLHITPTDIKEKNMDTAPLENDDEKLYENLPPAKAIILLLSISIVALCGIVYELIIGTVSSYLLGNSVYQFSLTIGFFMFAMGVGSYFSKFIRKNLIENFIYVEMVLALIGGVCSLSLFMTFPFAPFLYQFVMFFFIFTIGMLVGLEIPLLTRVLSQVSGTRRSIANVMSLDYIGALIGSVAFPLMLLPSLGLIRASFAIGLINVFVALLNIIYLKEYLPHFKRLFIMAGAIFITLFIFVLLGSRITSFAQHHLYFDEVIWRKQTPYQNLVVTRDIQKKDLRLFIDGHIQFSGTDEHRYHEALVHPVMSYKAKSPVRSVLVMGGGDGLAVRELLKYPSIEHIDLVDIDPEMTKLGKNFAPLKSINKNSLADPRVAIHNVDGFVFIKTKGRLYDRVILDFPDPHNEAISKLYSVEFYTMVKRRMAEGGVIVTQSSSPFFARKTYWSVGATLDAVFAKRTSYNIAIPAFGIWGFHLAEKDADTIPGEILPQTKYLTDAVFKAAQTFGKDIAAPDFNKVNSIFEPVLYQLYLEDINGKIAVEVPKS